MFLAMFVRPVQGRGGQKLAKYSVCIFMVMRTFRKPEVIEVTWNLKIPSRQYGKPRYHMKSKELAPEI